jgi:hypothetical protein
MSVKLSARTLRAALCCALLALATATTAVRAARLAGGGALTARGERQWYRWAYRHPELAAQLGRARAELRPRETVHLVVPAGRYEARWLRVMARYHLPEQALGGIHERGAPPFPPPGATTVALAWSGEVWVGRGDRAAPGDEP